MKRCWIQCLGGRGEPVYEVIKLERVRGIEGLQKRVLRGDKERKKKRKIDRRMWEGIL